jgi:nitroimidazol reductase NimA-like FMN-containing flavoprotein (pyridoxamine 5'-phosphate oxidase superfamily)
LFSRAIGSENHHRLHIAGQTTMPEGGNKMSVGMCIIDKKKASSSQEYVTVMVSGEVKFSQDLEMKKKIIENSPMVKGILQNT